MAAGSVDAAQAYLKGQGLTPEQIARWDWRVNGYWGERAAFARFRPDRSGRDVMTR